jgi:hypothetical protein
MPASWKGEEGEEEAACEKRWGWGERERWEMEG